LRGFHNNSSDLTHPNLRWISGLTSNNVLSFQQCAKGYSKTTVGLCQGRTNMTLA